MGRISAKHDYMYRNVEREQRPISFRRLAFTFHIDCRSNVVIVDDVISVDHIVSRGRIGDHDEGVGRVVRCHGFPEGESTGTGKEKKKNVR